MRLTLRCLVVVGLAASSAQARTIVFCAPPELRPVLRQAIEAQGAQAIDASPIDDALFNSPTNAKVQISHGRFDSKPVELLPRDVQEDWRRGLDGCRKRIARDKDAAETCGEEFSQAVWQRYLEHVQPERVIEVRAPAQTGDGAFQFEAATYEPAAPSVSVFVRSGPDVPRLVTEMVKKMLTSGKLVGNGVRPNSNLIPGDAPRARPELTQGTAQTLEPLRLPPGCKLPAVIEVSPADAPLAKTITRLWSASVRGHEGRAAPRQCVLSLDPPASGGTSELSASCGSSVSFADVFAGTDFGSAAYQATFARNFVSFEISGVCAEQQPEK